MGVKLFDIKDIIKYVMENSKTLNLDLIELGEQELKIFNNELEDPLITDYLKTKPRKYSIKKDRIGIFSKDFLENLFNSVSCIDIFTKCDKTLKLSLCESIDLNKKFDVLTNFGTTEHVGEMNDEFVNVQYLSFKNIHNMVKKDGIVFNVVPAFFPKNKLHGAFNYTCEFFNKLAELCNYKIIYNELKKRGDIYHVYCYFVKNEENEFINENLFMSLKEYIYPTKLLKNKPKKYFENYQLNIVV